MEVIAALFIKVWGLAVMICPIAFIAGFSFINQAQTFPEPIPGVPTRGGWVFSFLGSIALVAVSGLMLFALGFSHSSGGPSAFLVTPLMLAVAAIPIAYCYRAYKWISRVRSKAQELRAAKARGSDSEP